MGAILEHMALRVKDLDWHIRFFEEVFGMPVRAQMGSAPHRKVWLLAGIQLNEDLDFEGPEGRSDHLGIMPEDYEGTIAKAYQWNVTELEAGRNWIRLPEGMCIEIVQGKPEEIHHMLQAKPWI